MKRLFLISISLSLAALLLTACSTTKEKQAAEAVVERYFKLIAEHNYKETPELYDEAFFAGYGPEALVHTLKNNSRKLGELKSKKLFNWNASGKVGKDFEVTFIYDVKYSRHPAKEIFTVAKVGDKYLIIKHNFHSKALK